MGVAPPMVCTKPIPPRERLDYWRDAIGRTYRELTSVRLDISTPTDDPYTGTIYAGPVGPLGITTTHGDPLQVRQTLPAAPGSDADHLNFCLQDSGSFVIEQNRETTVLTPGTLTLFDTARPYTVTYPAPFRMHVFQVPRRLLTVRPTDLARMTAVPVAPDSDAAALVIPFLTGLTARKGRLAPHLGDQLARNAADLLATLIAERLDRQAPETGADTAATALRIRLRAFIDQHLADPDLSPQTIADAHHISVRYLHRLFEHEGATVGRWILRRRLQAARRDLGRGGRTGPTVTAVAQRWGFTSTSHFSRAFRAAYGVPPSEWQADRSTHPPD
ncbi:helix-turn-helix domain-containing protein [Streptomyces sp. NPDC052701]|uniref:helix-turn-helix domain-containing protein n=1 Tax=Streptomyces sp. NPDC052701 TaxID=3155533 RepID=UPI003449E232